MYNLSAQSFVMTSWRQPVFTNDVTALGVTRVLEAIRAVDPRSASTKRAHQRCSGSPGSPPDRSTLSTRGHPMGWPRCMAIGSRSTTASPMACSLAPGILFNHESPRRGLEFVTRKVTYNVAKIRLGMSDTLSLGNLDAKRDWGFAGDYVRAMWLMLQQDHPDDYVVGTGTRIRSRSSAK